MPPLDVMPLLYYYYLNNFIFKGTLLYKTFSASVNFFFKLLKSEFWYMKVPYRCTNAPRSICSHIGEVILDKVILAKLLLTLQVKTDISFYLIF